MANTTMTEAVPDANKRRARIAISVWRLVSRDSAINSVNTVRGRFGAVQNRLSSTISSLENSIENLTAAESRIRDVDIAKETADMTKNTILQQAAVSVLSQANMQPQLALSLLG